MDDKKAAAVLLSLLDKHELSVEEKEAVKIAIGILGWTSLSKSRIATLKSKKDKSTQW